MDIYKQIKEETDIDYLISLETCVDSDILRIGQEGEKILKMKASMFNITPEKYLEKQRKDLNRLKITIRERIEKLRA